tara:strand:+ start:366 stop:635 length:270 start_codon:yes stop_codon:yes gene_type:complete
MLSSKQKEVLHTLYMLMDTNEREIDDILYQLKNTPSFFSKSIWTWNEHVLGGVLTNLIKKNIISYEDVYGDLHFFIKIDEVKLNKILYS